MEKWRKRLHYPRVSHDIVIPVSDVRSPTDVRWSRFLIFGRGKGIVFGSVAAKPGLRTNCVLNVGPLNQGNVTESTLANSYLTP